MPYHFLNCETLDLLRAFCKKNHLLLYINLIPATDSICSFDGLCRNCGKSLCPPRILYNYEAKACQGKVQVPPESFLMAAWHSKTTLIQKFSKAGTCCRGPLMPCHQSGKRKWEADQERERYTYIYIPSLQTCSKLQPASHVNSGTKISQRPMSLRIAEAWGFAWAIERARSLDMLGAVFGRCSWEVQGHHALRHFCSIYPFRLSPRPPFA